MRGFMFNLHVIRCKHCRSFMDNVDRIGIRAVMSFLCRKGWKRLKALLEANGQPVPTFPRFVEDARP